MPEAAGIIVLPGLGHGDQLGGQALFPHILRHAGEDLLPDGGEAALIIPPDLAVAGLRQSVAGQVKPGLPALRRAGAAGVTAVKIADAAYPPVLLRQGAARSGAGFQLPVGPAQRQADDPVRLIIHPEAEAGFKVVVGGDGVVKAEALGAVARQAHGDAALIFREAAVDQVPAPGFVQGPGGFKSLHRSSPPFPSILWRRGNSPGSQKRERIWRW